ncbi:MAG TPA: HlyD family efflux transporter periplasmic adaptor subunit [Steroidobacter sp.]|uniref:HlyD family secretion protein n=1 Tax=Steroidobacter sp. TaxID=1978227 RepID=UPI002EDA8C63
MATSFSRTCRSLSNDSSRYALLIWGLAAALLVAWLCWLSLANVTTYELSMSARLEVAQAAHPISALLPAKILSTSVRLGKRVEAGEVLVEFDASSERLRLEEEEARLRSIPPQLQALEKQLADEENAAAQAQRVTSSAVEHARARYQEALATASFADENSRRLSQLSASGRVAEIEVLRARSEAVKARSAADALSFEIKRLEADAYGKASERSASLEGLRREVAELKGESELATATIARLRQDIEKHIIRAPVAGVIGEAPQLDVGAFVDEGGVLGSVVPSGNLRVVAEFVPEQVMGRVTPGQSARMRLDGFPWAQFGTLALRVERMASEIRNGRIRVELVPEPGQDPRMLQHGLPGSVEVAVERTTPLVLALRAAGQRLAQSGQGRGSNT